MLTQSKSFFSAFKYFRLYDKPLEGINIDANQTYIHLNQENSR